MQLAINNGTLNVTLSGGTTISTGMNGTNTLTLSGSQADINVTLASLVYQGTLNYNGSDTLTVTSTDSNAVINVDTVTITVLPASVTAPPPTLVPPPIPASSPMPAFSPMPAPVTTPGPAPAPKNGPPSNVSGGIRPSFLPVNETGTINHEKTSLQISINSDHTGKPEDGVFFGKDHTGTPGYMPERFVIPIQPDHHEYMFSVLESEKLVTKDVMSGKRIEQIQGGIDTAFREETDNLLLTNIAIGTSLSLVTLATAWSTGTSFARMLPAIAAWKSVDPLSIAIAADQEKSGKNRSTDSQNNLPQPATHILVLSVISSILNTNIASAEAVCKAHPESEWVSESILKNTLKDEGYTIKKFKIGNNCYEIYGYDKAGKRVEIYFDTKTLDIVKASIEE